MINRNKHSEIYLKMYMAFGRKVSQRVRYVHPLYNAAHKGIWEKVRDIIREPLEERVWSNIYASYEAQADE